MVISAINGNGTGMVCCMCPVYVRMSHVTDLGSWESQ